MAKQIAFLRKNKLDYTREDVTLTASEGNSYIGKIQDRSNNTLWITTGSTDASLTTIEAALADARDFTDILLVDHNFKSYSIQYWDEIGAAWADFVPAITEATNTLTTTSHSFAQVWTNKLKITIHGTIVPNAEKRLAQWIATTAIGRLNGWPVIKDPEISRNRQRTAMLSGRYSIRENVGGVSFSLSVKNWSDSSDLGIVEKLFGTNESFLVWLSGGDEAQFSSVRVGYRAKDIYLMKCANEHSPEWYHGLYRSGMEIQIKLVEVVD